MVKKAKGSQYLVVTFQWTSDTSNIIADLI